MKRIISSLMTVAMILGAVLVPSLSAPAWNGDANGDGAINLNDVSLIMRHLAAWDVEIDPLADFDTSGKVNLVDASLVMKHIAKWNVAPDSLLEAEYGVSAVDFDIPEPTPTEVVKGSEFGFDTAAADNRDAWMAAVAYLQAHPGTTLEIETGVYKMSNPVSVSLNGLKNCVIDGGGSTFLYSQKSFFGVGGGTDLFMIKNLTIDWDRETAGYPTNSVVRIKDVRETDNPDLYEVDYEFFLEEDASYATVHPWDSMMHMDPDTLTIGMVNGKSDIFTLGVFHVGFELTAPNVVTATLDKTSYAQHIDRLTVGDVWLLKHYNYSAPAFSNHDATNVTYRNINIYNGPGGGIYISGQSSHHVRIDGVTIGLSPIHGDRTRMSVTADALNFKNTGGYIIVENCDIGYQGDDCMNIHSTPGIVESAYDDMLDIVVRNGNNFYVGCEVGFYDANTFEPIDFTATVTDYVQIQGERWGMGLDNYVPAELEDGTWVVYNKSNNGENYIVRNNFFHENRARGLLLGSSNGLVENNRFYRHQSPPINISLDYGSQWIEGTGVHNLILRNNTFEECNLQGGDAYINIFAGSEFSDTGVIMGNCFSDILISGNTFINPKREIIQARSISGLSIVNNTVLNPDPLKLYEDNGKPFNDRGKIFIRGFEIWDATIIHNTWVESPYTSEDVHEIVHTPKPGTEEYTIYGNVLLPATEE